MTGLIIKNLQELRKMGYHFNELDDDSSMEIYREDKKIYEISRDTNGEIKVKDVDGEIMLVSKSVQIFMRHTKTQNICVMPG